MLIFLYCTDISNNTCAIREQHNHTDRDV